MPIHRWMHSAAGGTSQRLKPAIAIVRSLSRIPPPPPGMVPALLIVVIEFSLQPPVPGMSAVYDPVVPLCSAAAVPHNFRDAPGSLSAFENSYTGLQTVMPAADAENMPTLS